MGGTEWPRQAELATVRRAAWGAGGGRGSGEVPPAPRSPHGGFRSSVAALSVVGGQTAGGW